MNLRTPHLLHVFFLLLTTTATGQSYSIRAYTPADGLNQSQVNNVIQDHRGYLWIGTRNGIARFDGHTFVNFYSEDGLVDNHSVCILKDSKEQIFAVTLNGFAKFEGNRFIPYRINPHGHENNISWAAFDKNDGLWMYNGRKHNNKKLLLYRDDTLQDRSEMLDLPDGGIVLQIQYDLPSDCFVMRSSEGGIWLYKEDKFRKAGKYAKVTTRLTYENRVVARINGMHFILENGRFRELDPQTATSTLFRPLNYSVNNARRDKITLMDFERYMEIPWSHGLIYNIYVDRDNVLWIFGEEGLFKVLSTSFLNFTEKDALESNIWSVVEGPDERIWFASLNKTLQVWDGEKIRNVQSYRQVNDEVFYMGSAALFDGRIFFTQGNAVLQYSDGVFSKVPYVHSSVEKVYQSPADSSIFIGATSEGLIINKHGKVRIVKEFSASARGWVTDIALDPEGFYWGVTSTTVAKIYEDSVYFYPHKEAPVRNGYVVEVDSSGIPWFGGKEGLFMYDRDIDTFRQVNLNKPHSTVNGMTLMDNGRLLLGRMDDILVMDTRKWLNGDSLWFRSYDESDGFMGYEVQQDGIMRDSKGNYWISCIDRVVRFNPDHELTTPNPPILNLSALEVMDASLRWKRQDGIRNLNDSIPCKITLGPNQNSVRFVLRGITGYAPEKVRYSHMLDRSGRNWSQPSLESDLVFSNLPPGQHRLTLKAADALGNWSSPVTVDLYIKPTFWQTWFFLALAILLGSTVVTFTIITIVNRRQKRRETAERLRREMFDARIRQLIRQFDPHFTFNMMSSLGYFIVSGKKEEAYDHLISFSAILRKMLKGYDKILIPFSEELNFIMDYCKMQETSMGDKLTCVIEPMDDQLKKVLVPRMLVHSFVENAIKHGIKPRKSGGTITLSCQAQEESMLILVRDEGHDRTEVVTKKTSGTKQGVTLSKEIFRLLNDYYKKTFSFEHTPLASEEGVRYGMEVKVMVPLGLKDGQD